MNNKERPETAMARLLTKVVAQAGAVGELEFRRTLLEDEMKQIDLMDRKGRSASLKRKASKTTEPAALVVLREHRRSVLEHSKWLSRTRYLLEEEFELIGRLTSEIEAQLSETVDLLEKTAFNVGTSAPSNQSIRTSVGFEAGTSLSHEFCGQPNSPSRLGGEG